MNIDTTTITRLTINVPEHIDVSDVIHALNRVGAGFGDTLKMSINNKIIVDLQGQNQEAQRNQAIFLLGTLAAKKELEKTKQ